MKLIRYGTIGYENPGIITDSGKLLSLDGHIDDYNESFFDNNGLAELKTWLIKNINNLPTVPVGSRIGAPIARPSKIICVGLNYANHAKESGMDLPKEPVLFYKSTSAIVGPNDNVVMPKGSKKTDWEVELGVVIGKKATYVKEEDAYEHIAGYVLHNDLSERALQLEGSGQWLKGKSCDTFAPIGPWLVTKDEITDPHQLELWLKVNGEVMQKSNTSDFVFGIPSLVSYISQFMTLLPGDIISTGTPEGVGLGFDTPIYLKHGDVMELGIKGLGTARQKVISYEASKNGQRG